jgi:tetrahydromethanopterin S-methyltransferase subunit G
MQPLIREKDGIGNEQEYHELSERLRDINRAIIQLILIKEEYEQRIEDYLKNRDIGAM